MIVQKHQERYGSATKLFQMITNQSLYHSNSRQK